MASRPPANWFAALTRKIYHRIGFTKGYNFVLFFIFGGALFGFTLARLQYLALDRACTSKAGDKPLDCYYYTPGSVDRIGILLHLAAILPAALLACLQFVPVIRHRLLLFHRINGYLVLVLSLISTAGALMVARNTVGGRVEVQMAVGVLSIAFVGSLALAFYNVKRLQVEQHRAWMLRAWFYAGSIITMRIIMILSAMIMSNHGYLVPKSCAEVVFLLGSAQKALQGFPDCESYVSGADPNKAVLVPATMEGTRANVNAMLSMSFGAAFWLAIAIHAAGVEIYLHLTPTEADRLRNVSYQRQLEAGMKNPGRAGLTADKLGDSALWVPSQKDFQTSKEDVARTKVAEVRG
ncbi:hypothetical protein VTI74DRAFT_4145 [Chaetomium olivicolor]